MQSLSSLVITKDNNLPLTLKLKNILIHFDSQHAHSWYGFRSALFPKGIIFSKGYLQKGSKALNTVFSLVIALKPNQSTRMSDSKAFEQRRRTILIQVKRAYKRSNWIKSGPNQIKRGTKETVCNVSCDQDAFDTQIYPSLR
jgi:hypothetical protein